MRVALVEDNPDLRSLISNHLRSLGIHVETAATGEDALNMIDAEVHNLIILDRGLPDMEGLELLKILRDEKIKTPVLILTAKDGLGDKVDGLNSGADDYLVKPFEMDELVARVRALGRRPSEVVHPVSRLGNLEFHAAENKITIGSQEIELSLKEKDMMESLMRLPGRVVSKASLQNILYGHSEEGSANSIEVILHRLRKKLMQSDANVEVRNLRGIGYLIKEKEVKTK